MATTAVAPETMRVAQGYKPGAGFHIFRHEIPAPEQGKARSSLVTNEEESLLACARAGDAAAFASLVMPHRDGILRLAQGILRNREDAEDAVQTAFLDALRHLDSFQGAVLTPQKADQRSDLYVKAPRRWQVATGIFAWIR
jgi:hypothetical protein